MGTSTLGAVHLKMESESCVQKQNNGTFTASNVVSGGVDPSCQTQFINIFRRGGRLLIFQLKKGTWMETRRSEKGLKIDWPTWRPPFCPWCTLEVLSSQTYLVMLKIELDKSLDDIQSMRCLWGDLMKRIQRGIRSRQTNPSSFLQSSHIYPKRMAECPLTTREKEKKKGDADHLKRRTDVRILITKDNALDQTQTSQSIILPRSKPSSLRRGSQQVSLNRKQSSWRDS